MTTPAQTTSAPTAPVPIPIRRMDFHFADDTPKYWFRGNPWITHYLNAMSAVFPDGERFFIQSVRNLQPKISAPQLQANIRSFIAQEAYHGKEHEAFNKQQEERHGVPMASVTGFTKKYLLRAAKYLPHMLQLAITIALEHFTAILANQLLKEPEAFESPGTTEMAMFLWHAVEETEHKAVAFDVYRAVYGKGIGAYLVRVIVMLLVSIFFLGFISAFHLRFLWRDGELFNRQAFSGFFEFAFVSPGPMRKMIPDYLGYYRPAFHPWDHDNRALIAERVTALAGKELRSA